MMLWTPNARIRFGMAANSGWYTAPDTSITCPYGLRNPLLNFTTQRLVDYTSRPMILFRGTEDTLHDSELRTTSEADAQGRNRWERAQYMVWSDRRMASRLRAAGVKQASAVG